MFSYECWHKDQPEWKRVQNALTPGQARVQYFHHLQDAWSEIEYKDIRSRKCGLPASSPGFLRNAKYRGVPFARCGQKVKVGTEFGIIVGHNDSANFDVFFQEGKYKGLTMNCHPASQMMICIDGLIDEQDLWHCPESINCGPCQQCPGNMPCHHQCIKH